MIRRILVGLVGTHYMPSSVDYAVDLAKRHDAQLTGVTVFNPRIVPAQRGGTVVSGVEDTREQRAQIARNQVAEAEARFEAACQAAGIRGVIVRENGDAFERLLGLSRYHDLVLFGLRSIFRFDSLAGDPESLLIRLVSAGVRPLIAVGSDFQPVSRVLIAYNGSIDSAKAMKHFVQMRLWPHAELKIVAFGEGEKDMPSLLESAESYCRLHGYAASSQWLPGDPSGLHQAALIWGANMIVMGNSGRSVLLREVLGETLLATLRTTQIPLFLAQ